MSKRLLLVEDDFFIRDLYKRQLEGAGITVDVAGTGQEGLDAIKKGTYDLVLLDIMLPGIDGMAVLREVKSNEATKNTRIVLLTNMGQDDVIKDSFKVGAEGYLIKSTFTPKEVVREVQTFLDKSPGSSTQSSDPNKPTTDQTSETS
ncbi:MAG: hypothetical protein A3F33_03310 [Candidatus Woykebacteria bacterium RIFCSPHIGHO2_12_FULL_43_10]|uniref:Response regulatory domain-containing protein n=2 Tax=Candidatus Woykeibacteriota TaxID=1817899 RepID=A0A1G1WY07_9BACT|nr:MAG: hypothetical protein A2802_01955 [Candidatus Woykebacteria bacterium RIFCSPHIGHO2_01_FULL_43_29]OGY28931.1 MAG: hypothetical protein A3F33_03310 [Candidatus Woykebacteria bacterium RIFCSPHIGHO2_12_FULL_43_10]OGY29940.1 MAG: hypothetical protein A3J50_01885 [Candidatus Woykebacteria bacterium RIFCSPHIGHO2_02_FULL_43_16b]OGY32210.1 MAG: hypothetical protein A3A61_01720 [Candidatus Woykebacteria bacterium RIFCSPLOWO2_01_FULL_43_14]